jgi:hypothetical protein
VVPFPTDEISADEAELELKFDKLKGDIMDVLNRSVADKDNPTEEEWRSAMGALALSAVALLKTLPEEQRHEEATYFTDWVFEFLFEAEVVQFPPAAPQSHDPDTHGNAQDS